MRFALSVTLFGLSCDCARQRTGWVIDELVSRRFAEEIFRVLVLTVETSHRGYREGTQVRIHSSNGFGWVADTALTTEKPEISDTDLEAMMERIKAMNLESGGAMSQPITIGGDE